MSSPFQRQFSSKSPLKRMSPLNQEESRTNKERRDAISDSDEKRISVESGTSSGDKPTSRDYVKGGRVTKVGEEGKSSKKERKVETTFDTFDAGETYTKTKTITKKSGKVKVKKKKISAKKAERQAKRLDKRYTQV